jgi:hypothetical protein
MELVSTAVLAADIKQRVQVLRGAGCLSAPLRHKPQKPMNLHLLFTLVFVITVALSGSLQRAIALLLLGAMAVVVPVIAAWITQMGSRGQ